LNARYLEAGGARVVPLHYSPFLTNQTEFFTVLQSVNGVLFPGGGADIDPGSPMYLAASAVFSAARSTKAFPLMGHCLGFELICSVAARTGAVLSPFDAENITLPLKFTGNASSSSLFAQAPEQILDILTSEPVTMNNHMYGVSPASFEKYGLDKDFAVLSTNEVK
jgi:gamma-glutamyl hydrolase